MASVPLSEFSFHVDGGNIKQADSSKLLSVIIDPHLTWEQHTDNICKKICHKIGLFRHIRPVLPHSALLAMYKTLILPHFDYCDIVWGSASNTLITRVTTLQNDYRCVQVLASSGRYSRIAPLYQRLNWTIFKNRAIFHRAVLVYKSLNGLVTEYLFSSFSQVQHRYSTRRMATAASQYPRLRQECFRNSLKCGSIQI